MGFGAMAVRARDTWRAPPLVGIEEPRCWRRRPAGLEMHIESAGDARPAGMRACLCEVQVFTA